ERGGSRRYVLVFICLAVGLMAKPMLVTLPFVLLLLDYWPLGRLQMGQFALSQEWAKGKGGDQRPRRTAPYLILEKVPLFVLSAVSVAVSSITAKGQGILLSTKVVPMGLRIENAVVSYLVYVKKMIWPLDLAVFYPYPETVPFWQFGAAGLLLIAMTAWVVKKAGRAPYLFVGWLWYLGTLVPVMGLVQQGLWPALADRFAYIPLIGLFLILSWGSESLVSKWGLKRILLPITAGVILTALVSLTWWQLQYWKSSLRLFECALRVTKNNFMAHMNLGNALANQGREGEAVIHFSRALETGYPRPQEVYFNLGLAFASLGEVEEAILQYERALEIDPNYIDPHINLGTLLLNKREWNRSLKHFYEALRLDANSTRAYNNIGVIMLHQGKTEEAIVQFRAALKIDPEYAMAEKNLRIAMSRQGSQAPEQNQ
ncbi:MAG: tetratricopeptide repeat protein, partial [Desulfobacterales bacterium]|nr:tetratricopeptide repeat protein [Desulfobacterales bacterium]